MFQTLGHVVHHLQDMAQPQHVRNDMHLDVCRASDVSERRLNSTGRASEPFEVMDEQPDIPRRSRCANADPERRSATTSIDPRFKSTFTSASSFWTTRSPGARTTASASPISRTGDSFPPEPTSRPWPRQLRPGFPDPRMDSTLYEKVDIGELCAVAIPPCPPGLRGKNGVRRLQRGRQVPVHDPAQSPDVVLLVLHAGPPEARRAEPVRAQPVQLRGGVQAPHSARRGLLGGAHQRLLPRRHRPRLRRASQGYFIRNDGDEALQGTFELYYDGTDDVRYPIPQQGWDALAIGPPRPYRERRVSRLEHGGAAEGSRPLRPRLSRRHGRGKA